MPTLEPHFEPDLFDGVVVLVGDVLVEDLGAWQGKLYRTDTPTWQTTPLKAVPYCVWDA